VLPPPPPPEVDAEAVVCKAVAARKALQHALEQADTEARIAKQRAVLTQTVRDEEEVVGGAAVDDLL